MKYEKVSWEIRNSLAFILKLYPQYPSRDFPELDDNLDCIFPLYLRKEKDDFLIISKGSF